MRASAVDCGFFVANGSMKVRSLLRGSSTATLVWIAAAVPARAQDAILLQQSLQPDESGLASVLIDRHRLLLVRTKKEKGAQHVVEVTLDAQPPVTLSLRCIDQAAARQLVDALRPGGPALLDVTGRCRL